MEKIRMDAKNKPKILEKHRRVPPNSAVLNIILQRKQKALREIGIDHFDGIYTGPGVNNWGTAGIIPLAGKEIPGPTDLPFQSYYLPISFNCLAIQRSVLECARLKCTSIWIVCKKSQVSSIKKLVGNGVMEETSYTWRINWLNKSVITPKGQTIPPPKIIPIYYVVVPEKDRETSLAKAILWGAHAIHSSCKEMSRFLVPTHFYVSFPFSIIPYYSIPTKHIVSMKTKNKSWTFSYNGKTVKDGEYLPFIFTHKQFIRLREVYKRISSGSIYNQTAYTEEEKREWKKLSMKERYAERDVSLKMLMENFELEAGRNTDLDWFYSIHTWENYQEFLGSKIKPRGIDHPAGQLFVLGELEDIEIETLQHPYEELDLSGMYDDSELWKIEEGIEDDGENNEED